MARRTNFKEIYTILALGSLSIIVNAFFYPEASLVMGRAAGFYLNANAAGAICVLGYGISYSISNKQMRLIGQLLFTFAGIITFSRTFIVIWTIITIFSIIRNKKNILVPIIGVFAFALLFSFAEELTLSKERFSAIQSIVDGGNSRNIKALQEDSRQDTWAKYYNMIFDKPLFGHGFTMFQRKTNNLPGVHNTYLMILGEAGIIPFLLFIFIYSKLLLKSWGVFKDTPYLFNITLILVIYMMTGHTYFQNFYMVLLSMFVFESLKLKMLSNTKL
ncbi:O-antigen ligase family protein [Allomuricauda sp. F6463D]|uniref:O-antigen ligase family protein n=1 Tax=Allomuricauda sp. F6463D TaxID=2926409 RepID=UPI001FF519BE|nr:O-antigen ligase family protein [Muricauda sp. F6463D]